MNNSDFSQDTVRGDFGRVREVYRRSRRQSSKLDTLSPPDSLVPAHFADRRSWPWRCIAEREGDIACEGRRFRTPPVSRWATTSRARARETNIVRSDVMRCTLT